MTKKVTTLFILTLVMVVVLAVTGTPRPSTDANGNPVLTNQYNFMSNATKIEAPVPSEHEGGGKQVGPMSLGAYAADGGSPGLIVGRTIRDMQASPNPNRMVAWRSPDPKVHLIHFYQTCVGDIDVCSRYLHYNSYNGNSGVLTYGQSGVNFPEDAASKPTLYPQLTVDENGEIIAAAYHFDKNFPLEDPQTDVYWSLGGGNFVGQGIDTTLAYNNAADGTTWPRIAYQNVEGTWITHLATLGGDTAGLYIIEYWRKVGSGPTVGSFEPKLVVMPPVFGGSMCLAASPSGNNQVAITYLSDIDPNTEADSLWGSQVHVILSDDGGLTWGDPIDLINFDPDEDAWVPWIETNALYDTDGYLHIVWNATLYLAETGSSSLINPSRVMHWTNRVAGPDGGGKTSTITHVEFPGSYPLCGTGGWNTNNVGKPVISQCGDRLYTIWIQFGNPDVLADSNDCADVNLIYYRNAYNGEIYMSVSSDLEGSLWDAGRNLTNSHTADCDTSEGNECDADNFASMALYGMDGASVDANSWTNAGAAYDVRDALDPTRPDNGLYLDVQFVNDLIPDVAPLGIIPSQGPPNLYTNNPIKWFRLPCVDPIVAPRINIVLNEPTTYPALWLKPGTSASIPVTVENLGNAELSVDSINFANTTGPGGWLALDETSLTIPPASSDLFNMTVNPGGFITSPATLKGEVHVNSNDTARAQIIIRVSTVVADTVVAVTWDTIATALDVALTVANNGNAGNVGDGKVNLDFSNGIDCDSTQTVYLYDLSMLLMTDQSNYSWQPFYTNSRARDFNFKPVVSSVETGVASAPLAEIYTSGMFVSSDSTVGVVKRWYAPKANVSYMFERIDVFSFDGGTYNNVRLGEWIDWDIPSDTSSNNRGGAITGSYAFQQGLEYGVDTGLHACLDNDLRFGVSGLLGYYTSSEYLADPDVNHGTLYGGHVLRDSSLFAPNTDSLISDSVWKYLGLNTYTADNSAADDQQILLSFGSHTIAPDDTLSIWVVHASVYNGDSTAMAAMMTEAAGWYTTNRPDLINPVVGCCGQYNAGHTGNTNCSGIPAGETRAWPDLSDITKLIDRVYISQAPLCCEENGDVNASGGDPDLADITKLIDHVYISQQDTPLCP